MVSLIRPDVIEHGVHPFVCQQQPNQLPPSHLSGRAILMPLRESKSVMVCCAIYCRSTPQLFPRLVPGGETVLAVLTHPSFRANEPEWRVPSAITEEVLGHVGE